MISCSLLKLTLLFDGSVSCKKHVQMLPVWVLCANRHSNMKLIFYESSVRWNPMKNCSALLALWVEKLATVSLKIKMTIMEFHKTPLSWLFIFQEFGHTESLHMPWDQHCHGTCKILLWLSCSNLVIANQYQVKMSSVKSGILSTDDQAVSAHKSKSPYFATLIFALLLTWTITWSINRWKRMGAYTALWLLMTWC